MNSDKDNMLKDDQDNIQARELIHQVKWYTTMNLYMWGDQNDHGKNQSHYAKQEKILNQYNHHINVSNDYSNEA